MTAPLPCEVCEWAFSMNSDLKSHIRTLIGEKLFSCKFCGSAFSWRTNLKFLLCDYIFCYFSFLVKYPVLFLFEFFESHNKIIIVHTSLYCVDISLFAQSAGTVEYTDCSSAEGKTPPPMSVLDMTLNNLMVGFQ